MCRLTTTFNLHGSSASFLKMGTLSDHQSFHASASQGQNVTSPYSPETTSNDEIQDDTNETDADAYDDEGVPSKVYHGVTFHSNRIKKWSASLDVGEVVVDAGEFWTEEDAAKGYDELVHLYLDGTAPLNFDLAENHDKDNASLDSPSDEYDWNLPNVGSRHAEIIPVVPQYVFIFSL